MPINRHVFIQESKLPKLMGRIDYITSPKRQEFLYATHDTADRSFWKELARENRRMFKESGTSGKCIEARELIIALPEPLVDLVPEKLLEKTVKRFQDKYDVNCIAALHHNKRKTNYHIHLIFSERRMLEEIVEKVASRNMFYDKTGKHVRTKKEIMDGNGEIRKGCKIIKKGEVYERDVFTPKDKHFKSEAFLKEVKIYLMEHINELLPEGYPKLTVFDDGEIYLPMKKIGKNNPKEAEIKAANALREDWNRMADEALVAGVEEALIKQVKQEEITEKVKESIREHGRDPGRFNLILRSAISRLYQIIVAVRDKAKEIAAKVVTTPKEPSPEKQARRRELPENMTKPVTPEKPVKSETAKKYDSLHLTRAELLAIQEDIKKMEKSLGKLEKQLQKTTGWFKGEERDRLAGEIVDKQSEISEARAGFQKIVKKAGFETVADFMKAYKTAKAASEAYDKAFKAWDAKYGEEAKKRAGQAKARSSQPKQEKPMGVMERRLAEAKIRADAHNEEVRRQKQLTGKKKTYDMSL
ncbi:MAG: MobA/MobL family protein [Lachnospiraceae bacterium]|nr:MobA/MobL family protein [Lachnospiraceae bacterium]